MCHNSSDSPSAVGIIAEYNPFHNGHLYQLAKAKEITNSRYAIVIMSGSFVQRGTPAFIHKIERTKMALANGADLVIELPVRYATGSAEYFSLGAVSLLSNLRIANSLCFGSESGNTEVMKRIAEYIHKDCDDFNNSIAAMTKNGFSYPIAREKALMKHLTSIPEIKLREVIFSPNNILGIEYLKALFYTKSDITPVTIKREQNGYHDSTLKLTNGSQNQIHSATAIRTAIEQNSSLLTIKNSVPTNVYELLQKVTFYPVTSNLLSDILYYAISTKEIDELAAIQDVTSDLARTIKNCISKYENFEQFISVLKSKQFTYSRISRCLLHIILGIKQYSLRGISPIDIAPYARILGFKRNSSDLLKQIKQNSAIPMITKMADAKNILTPSAYKMLSEDIFSTSLYNRIVYQNFNIKNKMDIQTSPIIL